jgi:hypothetical protein
MRDCLPVRVYGRKKSVSEMRLRQESKTKKEMAGKNSKIGFLIFSLLFGISPSHI